MPDEIERTTHHRRIAAGEARSVVLRCHYDAPIEDVWDACTDPERLRSWFLPVSGDLRAGGWFQLEGNAGGEILACDPPQRLHLSWAYGDRPVDELELNLAVTRDGATLLALEHATVSTGVEWEGALLNPLPDVGDAWEHVLGTALRQHLRGEFPAG